MVYRKDKIRRYALGVLLLIVALNAFGGGWYGMAGAKDVPLEWLAGSPFYDYFIPAVFLFVVVGGSSLIAALLTFANHRYKRGVSLFAGTIMLAWIAVQLAIIGYVSWMQPAIALAGILTILLSYFLKNEPQSI